MPRKKKEEKTEEKVESIKTEPKAAETAIAEVTPAEHKERKKKKSKKKFTVVSIRRKASVARAIIQDGKNTVRINKTALDAIQNPYIREIIREPVRMAGDRVKTLSIDVNVQGGGSVGQAQAVRTAIAKGIVAFTKDDELRNIYLHYDRFLLVTDPRRVEPKKFKGRKARARFQKSYR
jgi:small subunit ribosomal protein S9